MGIDEEGCAGRIGGGMSASAPAKKARGRPQKAPDERASEMIHYRATVAEKAKYLELGGAKWFAAVLKRARVTQSTD